MTAVFWTPEAQARLEDIEANIAKDAPVVAKDVVARLVARGASSKPLRSVADRCPIIPATTCVNYSN